MRGSPLLRGPARLVRKLSARRTGMVATLLAALAMAGAFIVPATAQAGAAQPAAKTPFVSFQAFLSSVSGARYASLAAHGAVGAVRSQAAFNQMRSYVLNTYQGVRVTHSYLDNGSYFDCVVTMTQSAVRAHHITRLATPPTLKRTSARAGKAAPSQLSLGLRDAYGNAISCPDGTVPMQRLSLDRLMKFRTLRDFMAKEPSASGSSIAPDWNPTHFHAYGYQYVNNYGANSWLNLWNPSGDFTLSQMWIQSRQASPLQSLEAGWVHYPDKFGSNAVLFIYYTPNGYSSGCWDLDCSAFVQTSNAFALGAPWNNYSTFGGTQWGFGEQWQYYQGNWWLFIQGTAIGYYPGSVYDNGELTFGNASYTAFGGETDTKSSVYPPMGSGDWASGGFGYAAFQNTVFYIDQNYNTWWSSLGTANECPSGYSFDYHDSSEGSSWGTYFYFGGPGASC